MTQYAWATCVILFQFDSGTFTGERILSTLRKHAYSNILKILEPKEENFSDKNNSDMVHISAQNIDYGYGLGEAVLMSTQNLCFVFSKTRKLMYTPVKPSFTI